MKASRRAAPDASRLALRIFDDLVAPPSHAAARDTSRRSSTTRRPSTPDTSLEDAIARARDAVDHPPVADPVEARIADLEAELKANDEKRETPWQSDGVRVWCEARRPDGRPVAVIGRVRPERGTGT